MNIIFIVIDTLRADHLGCYGYSKPTSPAIDRLAEQGVLFERFFAPGIPTTPAHATLYTGQHPLTHNIVCHGGTVDLDRRTPVFTEKLQQAGYTTCAVDNLFDIKSWLARGYEFYINPSHKHKMRLLVTAEETNKRALEWIDGHRDEDFFLFLHYWEPHTPYLPPARYRTFYNGEDPFDPANRGLEAIRDTPFWGMWGDTWFKKLGPVTDPDYIVSLYDGEIRRADDGVAQIVEAIEKRGLGSNTLLIVTADHGEVMIRNGIFFDHHGLYEENIRVPLVMRWPEKLPVGYRVTSLLQQTDIAPTILKWAGAEPLDGVDGKDFGPLAEGESKASLWDSVVCCENTWQSKWALRTETHKLILSRRPDPYGGPPRELYDLVADVDEQTNLAAVDRGRADEMRDSLERWIAKGLARTGRSEDPLCAQDVTLGKRWDQWRSPRTE
jgi:arylsulfatase A-like enzyme